MNLQQYSRLVDEKVSDAWYNMEQAEKAYNQAKATYEQAMRERKAFDEYLEEMGSK